VAEPRVSVIMPTYNRAGFIGLALDSLVGQTRPPDEVLVIDDRSTDGTRAVVEAHPLRPRYFLQTENLGASVARNRGVELAQADTIVFLDSDDVLAPAHHETVLRILASSPDVGAVCCDCHMIGPGGEELHEASWTSIQSRIKSHPIASGRRSLADVFLFSTPFPGLTVRRQVYQEVGGLEQHLFPLDDYAFLLAVAASGAGVHYEHQSLAQYRLHGANESGPERAVEVGVKKLACVERARVRYPAVQNLGPRAQHRVGEVRRELAIALLRKRRIGLGLLSLCRALVEEPAGFRDLQTIVRRKLARLRVDAAGKR